MSRVLIAAWFLFAAGSFLLGAVEPLAAATEIDAPQLFAELDANGDGKLTANEAGEPHARLYGRLLRTSDANRDGQLDAEEFATGLTPVRANKDMVAKQGSKLPGGDALIVLIAKMDTSGDRRLDAKEIPERFRQTFARFVEVADADKNGNLDPREIADKGPQLAIAAQGAVARLGIDVAAELEKISPQQRSAVETMGELPRLDDLASDPKQAAALFERLDANGDKLVSADEAPGGLAQLVERADRDADGKLSLSEFQAAVRRAGGMQGAAAPDGAGGRRGVRQLLRQFDRNGNGTLGKKEVPPRLAANFARLDANGDGQLDADELSEAVAAMGQGQAATDQSQPDAGRPARRRQRPNPGGPATPPSTDEKMQ